MGCRTSTLPWWKDSLLAKQGTLEKRTLRMICPKHNWGSLSSQAGDIIIVDNGPHNSDNWHSPANRTRILSNSCLSPKRSPWAAIFSSSDRPSICKEKPTHRAWGRSSAEHSRRELTGAAACSASWQLGHPTGAWQWGTSPQGGNR